MNPCFVLIEPRVAKKKTQQNKTKQQNHQTQNKHKTKTSKENKRTTAATTATNPQFLLNPGIRKSTRANP
jgi:hypothetical protein